MFNYIMKDFFEASKPPVESVWNKDLKKWAEAEGSILMGSPRRPRGRLSKVG
jgi:hypothetical protein